MTEKKGKNWQSRRLFQPNEAKTPISLYSNNNTPTKRNTRTLLWMRAQEEKFGNVFFQFPSLSLKA